MSFRAPVRDLLFSLTEVAGLDRLIETGAWPDLDRDLAGAVLEHAGDLATDVLAPLNRQGDLNGAKYANGAVTAAPGFRDAYEAFAEGGWHGLAAETQYGGQGLPKALELAAFEMFHAANMAFGLCPMLTLAGIEALQAHGTERQNALYLPKLISGEWTGAMVLTEPQSGSDLGTLRTRAEPNGDGTYALHGQKIFITWGDHDCTDNIVHFVLARLPDAPAGVKGISLFLTSKFDVGDDGKLGGRNAFRPVGVEHKLGIHASPTCVMAYEGARAELVGELNQGLAHMFTMMNAARLAVGGEGVGIAERAYQHALAYALERRQGRSAWTGEASARIFDHPDVRRMLAVSKAKIEAARGVCLSTAVAAGLAEHAATEDERARWKRREDLFVPVAKAWSTDVGVEVSSLGVQVHGGMGFIEETGAAQHYRDARIAPIYEGTNGIQAVDLTGRKLSVGGGQAAHELVADIRADIAVMAGDPRLAPAVAKLTAGVDALEAATAWLLERKADRPADVLAGASAYLALTGDVAGGWMLAKGAQAAARGLTEGAGDPAWLNGKLNLLQVYADNVLAQA
ncbi:acyl-CoA dehydrogenase, partial [Caulobacter sp. 17J65-9]|uniref:acyl-CoA dehydrogenase n=1 Tax=Caulobacter sp. 17J65-9 TaxID=2709382 RepID=UPI0013C9FB73